MQLTYFDIQKVPHLLDQFYTIEVTGNVFPFEKIIVPLGFCGCSFVYEDGQKKNAKKEALSEKNLLFVGQFDKPYRLQVNQYGYSYGFNFTPTAIYKLTKADISKYTNQHLPLQEIDKKLAKALFKIFSKYKGQPKKLLEELEAYLGALPCYEDDDTRIIDQVVALIKAKEGMLSMEEILALVPYSQKTLETKFKLVIGVTPKKYMCLHRFLSLMRKYEKEEISLTDLIYKYDYYDQSHFIKDFKKFTLQSPKNYFKEEYDLIRKYLSE